MIKTVFNFLLCTGENIFFGGFSSAFAVKQAKEQILFQVQPLQMWKEIFCVLILGKSPNFLRPCDKRKSNIT